MGVMDGLKDRWQKLQEKIDEHKRERNDPENMRDLHHEQVQRPHPGQSSPMERLFPEKVEAARAMDQYRQQNPKPGPGPGPDQKVETPTKLTPKPVPPMPTCGGPTIAVPGSTYGGGNTARALDQDLSRAAGLDSEPKIGREAFKDLQNPRPQPHERLAAKLDSSPDHDLAAVAKQRSETMKNLEYEQKHRLTR